MAITPQQLAEETWGDRLHRAYRNARREQGLTYRQVARQVSSVFPVSDATIIKLEEYSEVPPSPRQRLVAFLALLVYGYDPREFELTAENTPIEGLDLDRVKELISAARSRCTVRGSRPPMVGARVDLDYLLPATVPA